jgi:dipeptidyl-peptidase-4
MPTQLHMTFRCPRSSSVRSSLGRVGQAVLATLVLITAPLKAQDRLKSMPGYDRFVEMAPQIGRSFVTGAVQPTWADDGKSFQYAHAGQAYRFDVLTGTSTVDPDPPAAGSGRRGGRARGRQFDAAESPDGVFKAVYRDRNLYVSRVDGRDERALTTDGSAEDRIKYGTASWVYGEELGQTTAMWWSPDGSKLAYYRFDENPVPDFFIEMDQTKVQSSLDVEAYPKAGVDNPVVDLFVYDVAMGSATRIDVRDGQPFTDDVVGHYVYRVGWSPDGSEITFNRANRRQNITEFTACSPDTGACRVVVREQWAASWTMNSPAMQYLEDEERFIWMSERNGFRNFYLYSLSGEQLATLTEHGFEVGSVVRVDEAANVLYYTARSGDNHMKMQLHRVGLDGRGDERLTDPTLHHAVTLSPDGEHFVDVAQTHDEPPTSVLRDMHGRQVAEIATSDMSNFEQLGFKRVEMFTFMAADSVTRLHGMLHRPSNFDASQSYPVLVSIYGGPRSSEASETFAMPHPLTEYGFLVVAMDSRSAGGRGKKFLDAIYMNLGVVEVDDQAAGMRSLWDRPYVDQDRVGIFGTSYGGYVSVLALLRHPDAFQAASASSPVTDWRHYDTIYTERYMWTPQGNTTGYDAGAAMTYAADLKGRLMLYYGTADNNVHTTNTMQLISALQQAGKSFDVQVGPDRGHSGINPDRMMEFFIANLVVSPIVF